jgi:hypothetical protein
MPPPARRVLHRYIGSRSRVKALGSRLDQMTVRPGDNTRPGRCGRAFAFPCDHPSQNRFGSHGETVSSPPCAARREDGRWPKAVPQMGAESDTSRSFAAYSPAAQTSPAGIGAAVGRLHMVLVAIHCESMFRISVAVPGSPKCPIS